MHKLLQSDWDILLHQAAWLNDNVISVTQALLKDQAPYMYIGGSQPPCAGQMCAFDIEGGEFVQILHNGHWHWLTVNTIWGRGAQQELHSGTATCRHGRECNNCKVWYRGGRTIHGKGDCEMLWMVPLRSTMMQWMVRGTVHCAVDSLGDHLLGGGD